MGQNIIVDIPSGRIRALAWKELKGNGSQIMKVTFAFMLITDFVSNLIQDFTPKMHIYPDFGEPITISPVSSLYNLFIVPVVAVGLCAFFLNFFRNRRYEPKKLMDGFHYFFKCVVLDIIIVVKITLWTFLLVVPGVLAAIRYSQARFILAENPSKSPMQCIEESKNIMRGNGGNYFILVLSFIGWAILAALPPSILYGLWGNSTIAFYLIVLFECVTLGALVSYFYLALTIFFEIATGHLRFQQTVTNSTYQSRYANVNGATNPYGQSQQNPYGQPQQNPYGQSQQTPYGQPQQTPYGQPQQAPTSPATGYSNPGTPAQPPQEPTTSSEGYDYPGVSTQSSAEPSADTPVAPAEPTSDPFNPQDPQ